MRFGTLELAVVLMCAVVLMLPEVSATRWTVGGNQGWSTNVNYTVWAKDKHFYNGDWLCAERTFSSDVCSVFVYDRNQMNVLEVNETNYESCNSDHPLHNWTRGAGRDVVPLNVTRKYYFLSGKGFCYSGMKIAINVENPPPPPSASPIKESNDSPSSNYRGQIVVPAVFAIAAVWDSFLRLYW
ncbi:Lamin-like protein [Vitis vinifera]|uniref:Lamin-like protein n=1 Tax=Vitis vinifera TaxID=29760 RepID=A0A438H8S6_VITVI|nr:Lamin-like protein [Vitis vinifera]